MGRKVRPANELPATNTFARYASSSMRCPYNAPSSIRSEAIERWNRAAGSSGAPFRSRGAVGSTMPVSRNKSANRSREALSGFVRTCLVVRAGAVTTDRKYARVTGSRSSEDVASARDVTRGRPKKLAASEGATYPDRALLSSRSAAASPSSISSAVRTSYNPPLSSINSVDA